MTKFYELLFCVFTALLTIFLIINIFWVIYAFVKYGNSPISEIPAWALWYMFKR